MHAIRWLAVLIGVAALFSQTLYAANQRYIDLSYGEVKGDFSTPITSQLNSVTAVIGQYSTDYNTSVSFSYLDLNIDGLSNETGIGDIMVNAGTSLKPTNNAFSVYPSLAIKLPTADDTRLLGTGEIDIGVYLTINHPCKIFICGVGLSYLIKGDPPGQDYNDIASVRLSGFKYVNKLGLGLTLQQETSLVDSQDDPLLFGLDAFYLFNADSGLYTNIQTGLNDATPELAFRLGIIQWY